mmetsp:Transcript_45565/g.90319  ORF Transcript_45565/g.90319 Transcript_45565/m.90319 type:complete len:616 (-) Transcript_45565:130-1977(-)|eukprot:CAMPEP_0172805888 /NCGR_PEP_ID=MMETSP1075-20121228/5999_1 /TAXON_ID=2916 /ORGANISM="Ceratium fusus, Strain PA161109" /LENGTH=615 /DNA_ID=CAMNT_0013644601 /DNA_START=36 /DNA_END=1883 /DNA_ORIENTATION=-
MPGTPPVHDGRENISLIASDPGSCAIAGSESEPCSRTGSRDPPGRSASALHLLSVGDGRSAGESHPSQRLIFKLIGSPAGLFTTVSAICLLGVVLPLSLAMYFRTSVVRVPAAADIASSVVTQPATNASTKHVSGHVSSSENSSMATGSFASAVDWWLSTEDGGALLAEQPPLSWDPLLANASEGDAAETIMLCSEERYQEILGIGTSLEAATAFNMARLNHTQTAEVLQALFDPERGVGFNLARITIGTSDFAPLPFYTYDDLNRSTASDEDLDHFSVANDEAYVLPLITKALNASQNGSATDNNDSLLLFASPWSPPSWMKSSRRLQGGHLFPWFRSAYARYLVAFIEAYVERGIHIHALTVQNEPLANKPSYPTSLLMPVGEVAVIRLLGQQLESAGLATRIWCFDHNWEDVWYPEEVLNDTLASSFIEGTAFHFYQGRPESMTKLHEAHPDKKIFFTEGSAFGVKGAEKIVEIFRNWASTYMAWVTMLDSELQPNGGPFKPSPPMLVLDNNLEVHYRFDYYMYGHFSKYVRRRAVRVNSTSANSGGRSSVKHVAFQNQQSASGANNGGSLVLVVVNVHNRSQKIRICHGKHVTAVATLPAMAVATFRWHVA